MDFKIGDKVSVLDETTKGIIVGITGRRIAIKDDNGMIYHFDSVVLVKAPVAQDELSNFLDIYHPLFEQKDGEKLQNKITFVKQKKQGVLEVDLHIEQLTATSKMLSNHQMLTLQLATAQRKLEYAIEKRIPRIIFIHGVGKGVLKAELQVLFSKYTVKFYDASYQKYGSGATEVYIYHN